MWNDEEGAAKAVTVHGVEVGLVTTGYKKEEAVAEGVRREDST